MLVSENSVSKLPIDGAYLIKPKEFEDERGTFLKIYTNELLKANGIEFRVVEDYVSYSKKGVIRGMHYQMDPYPQAKIISCLKGEIFDVIIDLRRSSPTFGKANSTIISAENHLSIYAPRGLAHGFLSMSDESIISYKADNSYSPAHERGVNWDDPKLGVKWPSMGRYIVSEKDRILPKIEEAVTFS